MSKLFTLIVITMFTLAGFATSAAAGPCVIKKNGKVLTTKTVIMVVKKKIGQKNVVAGIAYNTNNPRYYITYLPLVKKCKLGIKR